jgi:hypothetical protein
MRRPDDDFREGRRDRLVYRDREQVLTPVEKQTKLAGARLCGRRFADIDLSDTALVAADCTNAVL